MDSTFNRIFDFFLDKSKSFGFKTAMLISLIAVLVLIDFGLNFSYNLCINNKIQQLEKIQVLKKSYKNDSLHLRKVIELETKIINKSHYTDYINLAFSREESKNNQTNRDIKQNEKTENATVFVSTFWMTFSSTYSMILLLPFLIVLPLFPGQKLDKNSLTGWLALNIIWVALIALITVIAFQIPIIADNPKYNYLLNFGIHTSFLILIGLLTKKKK